MAAWNGVVPSQHSTGGRSTLGGITKTGNRYLRALLAQCACTVIQNASRHLEVTAKYYAPLKIKKSS